RTVQQIQISRQLIVTPNGCRYQRKLGSCNTVDTVRIRGIAIALEEKEVIQEVIAHDIAPLMCQQSIIHERGVVGILFFVSTIGSWTNAKIRVGKEQEQLALVFSNILLRCVYEVLVPPDTNLSVERSPLPLVRQRHANRRS